MKAKDKLLKLLSDWDTMTPTGRMNTLMSIRATLYWEINPKESKELTKKMRIAKSVKRAFELNI